MSFVNRGKVYELFAQSMCQADLYGFVEISGLLFDQSGGLLIDPAEEKLREEFKDVKSSLIPVHAIIRIDEVAKKGAAKISDLAGDGSNVTAFPGAYTPAPPRQDR